MKNLPVYIFWLGTFVATAHGYDGLYAVPTEKVDWDFCGLDDSDQCPPTISIEQAACEAPLIVNGRVLQAVNGETREDTVVQIQVDYRSEFFGSTDRNSIQKWGAGLENDEDGSIFTNSSGFFTTWIVASFNDTPTDLAPAGFGSTPCGTRSPNSQEELFFFLQPLPENEGKRVAFLEDGVSLNVNFSLSTSILQTGMAEVNSATYDFVSSGAFNDENILDGNCEVVYCCYNPGCGRCASVLKDVEGQFSCDSTYAPKSSAVQFSGSIFLIWGISSVIAAIMG